MVEADGESRGEVVAVAASFGYGVSGTQLARWHRAGLLPRPAQMSLGRGRGTETIYPPGTSAQVVALCQIKTDERRLDRVAFHLWWDGFPVEPELVRGLLTAAVRSVDEQINKASVPSSEQGDLEGRQPNRADRMAAQALSGFVGMTDAAKAEPFSLSWPPGTTPPKLDDLASLAGQALAVRLDGSSLEELIAAASDGDLQQARDRSKSLLRLMRSVAAPMAWLYGKDGSVFRTLDQLLDTLQPSDYAGIVMSVLVFAPHVPADTMAAIDAGIEPPVAYELRQVMAIRHQVPGAAEVFTPAAIRAMLRDKEAARRHRSRIEEFVTGHEEQVVAALASVEPWAGAS